ncbi:MAG: CoA-binding protein [Planctomycetes bacterium]|nr:CoA-binding protein [Planctomycetota bacterium]
MPSAHESFWSHASFAFVGHSAKAPFPKLSYGELRRQGCKVFAVDPSLATLDGDPVYPDLASLPEPVEAVVIETPRAETAEQVRRAADAGILDVWIHAGRDTPEALAVAADRGVRLLTGRCAVMYVKRDLSYHSIHKWIVQLTGRY